MQLARVIGEVVATVKDANLDRHQAARAAAARRAGRAVGPDAGRARLGRRRRRRARLLRARPRSGVSVLSRRAADRRLDRRDRGSLGRRGLERVTDDCTHAAAASSAPSSRRRRTGSSRGEAAAGAAADARRRAARRGAPAIDSVGAGVGEKVLVVIEGKAAGEALGRKAAAVDAAIVGIVDRSTSGRPVSLTHDDELRALVRESIARAWHARSDRCRHARACAGSPCTLRRRTPSHYRYALPESDGPCLIEPARAVQSLRLLPVARALSRRRSGASSGARFS